MLKASIDSCGTREEGCCVGLLVTVSVGPRVGSGDGIVVGSRVSMVVLATAKQTPSAGQAPATASPGGGGSCTLHGTVGPEKKVRREGGSP